MARVYKKTKACSEAEMQRRSCKDPADFETPDGMKGVVVLRVRKIVEEVVVVTHEEWANMDRLYAHNYEAFQDDEDYTNWQKACIKNDREFFHGTYFDAENKKARYGDMHYPGLLEVINPDGSYLIQR